MPCGECSVGIERAIGTESDHVGLPAFVLPVPGSNSFHRRGRYQPQQSVDRRGATPSDLSADLSSDLPSS
jgi:hypothetical protein